MRIAGSSRFLMDPSEKRTLARMARDGHRPKRSEKGEASDDDSSASLEEISAEDFKQDARSSATAAVTRSRVWMGYPVSRNYATDLYNFAWAQAVQNKPLGLDLNPVGTADSAAAKSYAAGGQKSVKEESCDVIIEDSSDETGGGATEKEEGELEEGEIGFESEAVASETIDLSADNPKEDSKDNRESDGKEPEEIGEFDRRVSLILEELEAVTVEEAETSFESVCSRLRTSFENLKPMFVETESAAPVVDALVQQAFMGIQTVHSVLSSGNLKNKEQNKALLLRLLVHITNQYSALLTQEQAKEIDAIVRSLVFEDDSKEKDPCAVKPSSMNDSNRDGQRPDTSSHGLVSSGNPFLGAKAVSSDSSNGRLASLPPLEMPTVSRSRVEFSPLLDLHADYDECSLPSPTRDYTPALPLPKPIGFGMGTAGTSQPIPSANVEAEDGTSHPYVTDALKAVSSYQQKYGRTSFLASNRLPSPTPSEDGNDDNDNAHDEVSSSSTAVSSRIVDTVNQYQFAVSSSSSASADSSSWQQPVPVKLVAQPGSGPSSVVKPASKSRDPRLRLANAEVRGTHNPNVQVLSLDSNSTNNEHVGGTPNGRKHKAPDEPVPEDHASKRQRNGLVIPRDAQMQSGRDGRFEEVGVSAPQPNDRIRLNESVEGEIKKAPNGGVASDRRLDACTDLTGSIGGAEQNPSSCNVPISLPSLLKDIAVNPTMLMQLIQMEQQRLAAEAQQKPAGSAHGTAQVSSINGLPGAVPSVNGASVRSTEVGQGLLGRTQVPVQSASMVRFTTQNSQSDVGRIRMKPRDPRRILHNNVVQKSETMGSGQTKTNATPSSDPPCSKDHLTGQEQEHLQTTVSPSQLSLQQDMARQFTKNLKNVADVVSSSQSTSTSLAVPQSISLPTPSMISKVDPRPSSSQLTATSPAVPQNISEPIPSIINKVDPRPAEPKPVSGVASEGSCTGAASQSANPWGDVDHLLDGYDDQQKAAFQRERTRRIAEQNKMFAARKLCLVLDLDHTLLNSAKFVEVDPVHEEILRKKEEQDREKPQRHLFRFQHMGMWTKLRPGIWNFLEKASNLYELHLYTMGNKLYATEMAKVLDPTGSLFAGRVISRGDDGDPFDSDDRVPKSKDLDGVLGMESAVVIIDDSVRVWPHNKLNLIVVERYTYFPCSRRQFGLLGPSLLEIDHDERPEDGTLASSLAVIERIHQNFFSHRSLNDVDVRNILAAEQRKILAGCCIVFSRVFPVGEANPHLHPLWQTAEQFGAVCKTLIDEQVTHVVANSLGTDKVNWALAKGRFVVGPGWVEASALLYRRANEHDYAVKQ